MAKPAVQPRQRPPERKKADSAPAPGRGGSAGGPEPVLRRVLRSGTLRALAVVVVAAVGFVVFIPTTRVNGADFSSLVVPHTGISQLVAKPEQWQAVPLRSSQFPALKGAAARAPQETGGWSALWGGSSTNVADYAELLVTQLPSAAEARTVQGDMEAVYLKPTAWSSQSLARTSMFHLATLPHSEGAMFAKAKTTSGPGASLATITFSLGHVAALEFVELSTPARAAAAGLAQREVAVLNRVEPRLSLARTVLPPVASLVYWLVAATLGLAAVFIPILVSQARARNQARQRYQYAARGSKLLRRRAAPQRRFNAGGRGPGR
jgi:hypothetical protein